MEIGESVYSGKDKKSDPNKPSSLTLGIVQDNWDALHPGEVRVNIQVDGNKSVLSDWMPVAAPYASNGSGMYMLPEVGSTVVIGYIDDNSVSPVVIGSLWLSLNNSSVSQPKNSVSKENGNKVFCTPNGHMIRLCENKASPLIEIISAKGLQLKLDDKTETVTLSNGKDTTLSLDGKKGEITVNAKKSFSVKIGGKEALSIEQGKMTIKSDKLSCDSSMLSLKGKQTSVEGSSVKIKAQGDLSLQSSGMAQVKGSMLKLN